MSTPDTPSDNRSLRQSLQVVGVALKGAPGPFAVGIAGAVIYAAMTVAASLVLGWVTDDVILAMAETGQLQPHVLRFAMLAIVGVGLFKAIGVAGRRYGAYVAQYTLQSTYRRQVTRQYLALPLKWHRRHSTGQLLSNANSDVESAFFLAAPLPMAVGASALVVITATLLVLTDPVLAAIGFSVVPLLMLANWQYQRRMRSAAVAAQQARAQVAQTAHDSFDAALVIKTLGREGAETQRFATHVMELRDRLIRVGRLRAFFDPVVEALPNIGILMVLAIGAGRVRDGILTPGDLVLFAYLFRLLALPIRIFGWMLGEMPRAVVGWQRIRRVLDVTGHMDWGQVRPRHDGPARGDYDDVSFHYPPPVHHDLSDDANPTSIQAGSATFTTGGVSALDLHVEPGATVAIVGETGAGKSTLASLMVRLYDPDMGVVRLDGHPLPSLAEDELSAHALMVFQESFMFDDTVRNNITLGGDFTDEQIIVAAQLACAHDFINAMDHGYDTPIGERGASLSGGQRQRVALARALVRSPRLLVLDDATSAIDPTIEARILTGLRDAHQATTVLLIAYRQHAIEQADHAIVLHHGEIVASGTHTELLAHSGEYRRLLTAFTQPVV